MLVDDLADVGQGAADVAITRDAVCRIEPTVRAVRRPNSSARDFAGDVPSPKAVACTAISRK
jgi:hypothetical protein